MTEYNKQQFHFQIRTEFFENDEVAGWYALRPTSHRALARALTRDGIPFLWVGGVPRVRRQAIEMICRGVQYKESDSTGTPKWERLKVGK
jgi:hypothetical protein